MLNVLSRKAQGAGVTVHVHCLDAADPQAGVPGDFNLALCVFTVVNYLTRNDQLEGLMRTMSTAVQARRGCCLLSFAENIGNFARALNRAHNGSTAAGNITRKIHIAAEGNGMFTYSERGEGTLHGVAFAYGPDVFPLREWTQRELSDAAAGAGLALDHTATQDASYSMQGAGERYWVLRPR